MPHQGKHGVCCCCRRETVLTFHHLVPRKVHCRTHFKKHFSQQDLNQGIMICRAYHSGLPKRFDEMQLTKTLNTETAIRNNPELTKFFTWVSKQKIRS